MWHYIYYQWGVKFDAKCVGSFLVVHDIISDQFEKHLCYIFAKMHLEEVKVFTQILSWYNL